MSNIWSAYSARLFYNLEWETGNEKFTEVLAPLKVKPIQHYSLLLTLNALCKMETVTT
jgi:hypothetical protein